MRPKDPAHATIQELERSLPGVCAVYELGLMHLDTRSEHSLVKFLQKKVPAALVVAPQELLQMIDGYPGVIYRWTSEYHAEQMRSAEDLASVAREAQEYRFTELETVLPALSERERTLAIRLALAGPVSAELWDASKETILDSKKHERLLDDLRWKRVLESSNPPSYGHAKRHEAVLAWFLKNRPIHTQQETEFLVFEMAGRIQDVRPEVLLHAGMLANFLVMPESLGASPIAKALCQSAACLFLDQSLVHELLEQSSA